MNIKPIKTKSDYKKALLRIEKLWNAKHGSKESDELEVLSALTEKYEEGKFNILPPDPVEAIKFRLEQMGMSQRDLACLLGANRASEILKRKRNLTIDMIKVLRVELKIPTDSLIN